MKLSIKQLELAVASAEAYQKAEEVVANELHAAGDQSYADYGRRAAALFSLAQVFKTELAKESAIDEVRRLKEALQVAENKVSMLADHEYTAKARR